MLSLCYSLLVLALLVELACGWEFDSYLKASNTGAVDKFGSSVALYSDTIVVGAPLEDSSATGVNGDQQDNAAFDSGAVYVFISLFSWSQQAYLKASNVGASDQFGSSVAIYGDTVVVGAPGEDSSATGVNGNQQSNAASDSGAVYVFTRSGWTWSQQAYLKASNTDAGDLFGCSIAIYGDTVIVGAYNEDSSATGVDGDQIDGASNSGAAYVFIRSGTTWSQQAYLKASNTGATDQFGFSVAIYGDTVVVGAFQEDSAGVNGDDNDAINSGAAYVFFRNGATWSQQAYLKASNADATDQFGFSVAIYGDTVLVGANSEDSAATAVDGNQKSNSALNSGAAYLFHRAGNLFSSWSQQAYLKSNNAAPGDQFGSSVAIVGSTILVGAPAKDASIENSEEELMDCGAVNAISTEYSSVVSIYASNMDSNDQFGRAVALSDKLGVICSPQESSRAHGVNADQSDNQAQSSGACYVFSVTTADTTTSTTFATTIETHYAIPTTGVVATTEETQLTASDVTFQGTTTGISNSQDNISEENAGGSNGVVVAVVVVVVVVVVAAAVAALAVTEIRLRKSGRGFTQRMGGVSGKSKEDVNVEMHERSSSYEHATDSEGEVSVAMTELSASVSD